MIWIEVFFDGKNFYFNEVGYRPNGSMSFVGIDYLCGINSVAAEIYYDLMGEGKTRGFPSLIKKEIVERKKRVCEFWVSAKAATIGRIDGIDAVRELPNVLGIFPKYSVGDTVPHTNGFAQNACVIHFAFDEVDELKSMIDRIRSLIVIEDEYGDDMIIHKNDTFLSELYSKYEAYR